MKKIGILIFILLLAVMVSPSFAAYSDCAFGECGSTSGGGVAGSDTQVQFNDGGAMAGDSGLTFNKSTNALTLAGSLLGTGSYSLNLGDSHIQWLGTGDSIQTAITNATAGDTIYLASGTYTTTGITIDKQINLVGQGTGQTIINFSHTNNNGFTITASNVSLQGFTVNQTINTDNYSSVRADGSGGTVLSGVKISGVIINTTSGATGNKSLAFLDSSGDIYNSSFNILNYGVSNASVVACILANAATAEAATTVNLYNVNCKGTTNQTTGTRAPIGLRVLDSSATNSITANTYGGTMSFVDAGASATTYAATSDGSDATLNSYFTYFYGSTAEVVPANSGVWNNNANFFNIKKFYISGPENQVVGAGDVIVADGCGTIKSISAGSNVTTNTTDTFSTPTARQNGCCMYVVNTDTTDTITLDNNSNFYSAGAADVVLGPSDSVTVCTNGSKWYQIGGTGNN